MKPRTETLMISDDCFWPSRRGLQAHIVDPDIYDLAGYPFHGLHDSEAVIWIDDDPINGPVAGLHPSYQREWTCVITRAHLVTP